LMNILWNLGEGSVTDVQAGLQPERPLAYTSVSTVLRILEQKAVLKTRKEGRGHIYIPILKRVAYESRAVKHVVDHVFQGAPVALVKQLVDAGDLRPKDIEELRSLLA